MLRNQYCCKLWSMTCVWSPSGTDVSCFETLCSTFKTQHLPLQNVLIRFAVVFLFFFFRSQLFQSFNSYPVFPVFSLNYDRYSDTLHFVSWGECDDYFMKFWCTIFTIQIILLWVFFIPETWRDLSFVPKLTLHFTRDKSSCPTIDKKIFLSLISFPLIGRKI